MPSRGVRRSRAWRGLIPAFLLSAAGWVPAGGAARAEEGDPLCGLYCLHVALSGLERSVTREELDAELGPPPASGYSLGRLAAAAEGRGLTTRPVETNWDNLRRRSDAGERFVCLARLDGPAPAGRTADGRSVGGPAAGGTAGGEEIGHFVLLAGFSGDRVARVIDPPRSYELETRTVGDLWDGSALLIADGPLAPEEDYATAPWSPWAWAAGLAMLAALGLVVALTRRRAAAAAVLMIGLAATGGCDGGPTVGGSDATATEPSPRAVFSATERDLGLLAVDPAGYETTFPLANRGTAPLRVLKFEVGCGCTKAAMDKFVLAPGETVPVRVTVTPEQEERRGTTVVAVTDDSRAARTVLKVRWDAVAPRRFEPARLDFGEVRPGETVERTVTMPIRTVRPGRTAGAGSPGRIGEPRFDPPLTAAGGPAAMSGAETLTVRLTAPEGAGVGRGQVAVPLTDGFRHEIVLPVRWRVRPPAEAIPPRILLRPVAGGGSAGGCLLRLSDGIAVTEWALEGLSGEVMFVPAGDDVRVTVALADEAGGGEPRAGRLRLTLGGPATTLSLPVVLPASADL